MGGLSSPRSDNGLSSPRSDDGLSSLDSDDRFNSPRSDNGLISPRSDDGLSNPRSDDGLSSPRSDDGISSLDSDDRFNSLRSDDGLSSPDSDNGPNSPHSDGLSSPDSDNGLSSPRSDSRYIHQCKLERFRAVHPEWSEVTGEKLEGLLRYVPRLRTKLVTFRNGQEINVVIVRSSGVPATATFYRYINTAAEHDAIFSLDIERMWSNDAGVAGAQGFYSQGGLQGTI